MTEKTEEIASSSFQHIQPLVEFLSNTCLRSKFSAQSLFNLSNFSPGRETIYNYSKTQDSPYGHTKLAIRSILRLDIDRLSNCDHDSKKTVSFDDMVHPLDEENIVIYVYTKYGMLFNNN